MSFLTRFFHKKNDEDYETILSSLALDIQRRQVKLSEIRLRERRSTLLATLYTLAGWVAYVSLWYLGILPNQHGRSSNLGKAMRNAPVFVGPIIILFIRRIIQIWYTRKGDAEEKTLQTLLKQQRSKVEEIKKKTNYYSTRELIQRYDEPTSSPALRQRLVPGPTQPSTPQRQPPFPNGKSVLQTPNPFNPLTPVSTPSIPSNPPRKQWYDKLADALLGDDDHTPNASTSRYALICEKCFAHNGLVKESMWADAQYVCPKCNHFNPSANARKLGNRSPASPPSASSEPTSSPNMATSSKQRSLSPQNGNTVSGTTVAADASMMEIDDS
ncbi:Protein lunapark [Hypsizygus marmoreus]|uniref:Endoplasmic reticulum junction formation protein lunapark n=1 Tax=Hypsizygus marmoreus TaxID=39966 RepID=A0A369JM24_HYPMA|nr:Protein lunapark [Hypsizygus marmoreus]